VIDNCVPRDAADWFDPGTQPEGGGVLSALWHGVLPTRPAMPRHKARSSQEYITVRTRLKDAASKVCVGKPVLLDWGKRCADTRIHGTTGNIGKVFNEVERSNCAVASEYTSVFEEAPAQCMERYIELQRAYYSCRPEYVGRQVGHGGVQAAAIFNQCRKPSAVHALAEPGKFATEPNHLHSRTATSSNTVWITCWIAPG